VEPRLREFGSVSSMLSTTGGLCVLYVRRSIRFRFSSNFRSFEAFQVLIDWWDMSASSSAIRNNSGEIESMIRWRRASSRSGARDHWQNGRPRSLGRLVARAASRSFCSWVNFQFPPAFQFSLSILTPWGWNSRINVRTQAGESPDISAMYGGVYPWALCRMTIARWSS
jgi:hypothetical protein